MGRWPGSLSLGYERLQHYGNYVEVILLLLFLFPGTTLVITTFELS